MPETSTAQIENLLAQIEELKSHIPESHFEEIEPALLDIQSTTDPSVKREKLGLIKATLAQLPANIVASGIVTLIAGIIG